MSGGFRLDSLSVKSGNISVSICQYLSVHSPHPSLSGILQQRDPGLGVRLQARPGDAGRGVGLGGADKLQRELRVVREVELVHCHVRGI